MPHAPEYRCEVARSAPRRAIGHALVDEVYESVLGLPRLAGAPPEPEALEQERLLIIWTGERAVATMTLQSPAFAPHAPALPLELEASYGVQSLGLPVAQLAEVRRLAALPGHREAVQHLYAFAAQVCTAQGITHWIGLVEAVGSRAIDAPLVHSVLAAHKLVRRPLLLRPNGPSALFDGDDRKAQLPFAEHELQRVPVPHRIHAFARALSAKVVSVPGVHPCYPRLVVPMLAAISDFQLRSQYQPTTHKESA